MKAEALLPAIAYGDALGLPVEKKTREEIAEIYGKVTQLEDITSNPFLGEHPAGTTSDDTQLSVAVAESIISSYGINMRDIASRHIKAFLESDMGWGGSTRNSMKRLQEGMDFRRSGEPEGKGNGVLMKMAPLTAHIVRNSSLLGDRTEVLDMFTRMTHDNDLSVVTSLVHHEVCTGLLRGKLDHEEVPAYAAFVARWAEKRYPGAASEVSRLLGNLASLGQIDPDAIVALAPRGGFYAPETLIMAYGSFALEPIFPASAVEAVNLGGDADSISSVVSAMSVMYQNEVVMPADINKIKDLERLKKLSTFVFGRVEDNGRTVSFTIPTETGWISTTQDLVDHI